MTSFVLSCSSCDGHVRALSKAITMCSRLSKDAMLVFKPDRMRLAAKDSTGLYVVRFVFDRDFFSEYHCDSSRKVYINIKSLQLPFRSSMIYNDRDSSIRSQVQVRCTVEDTFHNRIVFQVGGEPPSSTLTYRLPINDLPHRRVQELNATNRTVAEAKVELVPQQTKKERFLLSAFNNFAPDIDQVTIKASQDEIVFIGSTNPLLSTTNTTSEFTHRREDFSTYYVEQDTAITFPLRNLKFFLNLFESNKLQAHPRYVFEGVGLPAHFKYDANLYRGHFMSSTPYEHFPHYLSAAPAPLPIGMGPNESFIAEENVIEPASDDYYENDGSHNELLNNEVKEFQEEIDDDEDKSEYGYNDNESDISENFIDGNLEGLHASKNDIGALSIKGYGLGEGSIRGEMTELVDYDSDRVKEILNLDQNPEDFENVVIQYSSDEE